MLTLPIPPSANRYWRSFNGRVVVSEEARTYKQAVFYLAHDQGCEKIDGGVSLRIVVYRGRKAGDLDNYIKVLLDALKGILYEDDDQVIEIHAIRRDDKSNPRVEVVSTPGNYSWNETKILH